MKEILVAVLVIGIIVLAVWFLGTRRSRRPKRPTGTFNKADAGRIQAGSGAAENQASSGAAKNQASSEVDRTQPSPGAAASLEACYRAYLELEEAKHRRQAAAVVLTRQAGILERIQILLGFYRDIQADGSSHAESGRPYVEGQLRAIEEDLERFSLAKGNPMGKEQFLRSVQLEPNDVARAEALLHQMEREKRHLEKEDQYRFYLGVLNALSSFSWNLKGSRTAAWEQGDFKEAFAGLCGSLTETLSRAGVIFKGFEEADEEKQKEWFRILDSAKSYPCALKKEDETLLVYGRAAKAGEDDDKRKGRKGNRT